MLDPWSECGLKSAMALHERGYFFPDESVHTTKAITIAPTILMYVSKNGNICLAKKIAPTTARSRMTIRPSGFMLFTDLRLIDQASTRVVAENYSKCAEMQAEHVAL